MSVWAEFNPLESIVIGSLPEPEKLLPFTSLKGRYANYFAEIINRSRSELDHLEKVIRGFGVKTYRSKQHYPIFNGSTINTPPLGIRDIYTVYGDSVFKGNQAFEWTREFPHSCDDALSTQNYRSIYELDTHDIFYNDNFDLFDAEEHLARPFWHPSLALRCGNDIFISESYNNDGNRLGEEKYRHWAQSVNPKLKFHLVRCDGHLDGQLFLIRPGMLLTSLDEHQLPEFFDSWDKIHVEPVKDQWWNKKNTIRHKHFHPVIAKSFFTFLQTCTEETYFDVNSLSIDEHTVLFTGSHPELFKRLEKKGITCIGMDMNATMFWDNGTHCVTNELSRKGELEDYA